MKTLLLVTALLLSACSSTGTVTADSVAAWVKANCGIVVTIADIAALISKDPNVASAAALGAQVCAAFNAQTHSPTPAEAVSGVVVVNGVPIHYTR